MSTGSRMTSQILNTRNLRSQQTRNAILLAATNCFEDNGLLKTTMDDIAAQAKIGRATLYRHFSNKEELLAEVVAHNLSSLQAQLKTVLKNCQQPEEFFVETAVFIIIESQKSQLTTLLLGDENNLTLINQLTLNNANMIAIGDDLINPFYKRAKAKGLLRDWVNKTLLQEWTSRIILSFLSNPSPKLKTKSQLRRFFYDAIIPSILIEAN